MNFPLMTSIFCSSLLQGVFRRRFQPSIQLLYPSYSSILFKKSSTSSKFSKNLQVLLFYLLAVVVPVGLAFKSVCYYISSFCFSVSFQKRGLRLLFFINSSPSSLHFGGAREFRSSREREKDRKELKKTKIMKIRLLPYHQTTFPAWFFQIWSPYLWDLTLVVRLGNVKNYKN